MTSANLVAVRDLLARVEAASGPDREIEITIWRLFDDGRDKPKDRIPLPWLCRYTESIDDAVALIGRVLPDFEWQVSKSPVKDDPDEVWDGALIWSKPTGWIDGGSKPLPLALCTALLKAVIAKAELEVHYADA